MIADQPLRLQVRKAIYRVRRGGKPIASGPGFSAPGRVIWGHVSRGPVDQRAQAIRVDEGAAADLQLDQGTVFDP